MKKILLILVCSGTAIFFVFSRRSNKTESFQPKMIHETKMASQKPWPTSQRQIASLPASTDPVANAAVPAPHLEKEGLEYFQTIMKQQPPVAQLYKRLKEVLPESRETNLIATYIAEGIGRQNTQEFADFMLSLNAAVNEDPEAMYDALMANQNTLRNGALTYQLSLNLANTLNLPIEKKTELLGQGLGIDIQFDSAGQIDALSSNVLTALILLKNSGATTEQARPYVEHGLEVNQHDPEALSAYQDRVRAYYPELL